MANALIIGLVIAVMAIGDQVGLGCNFKTNNNIIWSISLIIIQAGWLLQTTYGLSEERKINAIYEYIRKQKNND
jgi:hypothetical protein